MSRDVESMDVDSLENILDSTLRRSGIMKREYVINNSMAIVHLAITTVIAVGSIPANTLDEISRPLRMRYPEIAMGR